MGTFLTIIIAIACVLLILLVLMQNPKGGGLSTDFGAPHQLGGVKQTNEFVERATWSLAGLIGVLSIVMTLMYSTPHIVEDPNMDAPTEQPTDGGETAPQNQGDVEQ